MQRSWRRRLSAVPEKEIRKRGGAIRWRTIGLPDGKYEHIAIVRKTGPRGGRTVAGPVRKKKAMA
jgi:hypothetical protein